MKRAEILERAKQIVCHDRQDTHGKPEDVFGRIAVLWEAYVGMPLSAADVAVMMVLFKIARFEHNPGHSDNVLDAVGYMAIAGELSDV